MKNNIFHRSMVLILILCHLVFITGGLNAEGTAETGLLPLNARLASLGGYHPAFTGDTMTIFTNPAGFRSIESELLISEVTLGLTGPIFNIISAFISGGDLAENTTLLNELSGVYSRMDLLGPVSFAFVGDGLALGLFSWTDVEFDSKGSLSMSSTVTSTLLITGGYAFRIPLPARNIIDIGVQLKALVRGSTYTDSTTLELFTEAVDDPLNLLYLGEFALSVGGGMDLGILYSMGDRFAAGITARNLYTPTLRTTYESLDVFLGDETGTSEGSAGYVPLDLSAGVKFSPPLGPVGRYVSDLVLYLDYVDILDTITHPETSVHWFLHFGLGMEVMLLDILTIRGGFSEGLCAAGLGLNLTVFELDVSMFGSELSSEPNLRPSYNMVISIRFIL